MIISSGSGLFISSLLVVLTAIPVSGEEKTASALDDSAQHTAIEALEERVRELERDRDEQENAHEPLRDEPRKAGVFDAASLDLGGFLTQTLTLAHGDSATEVSPNQTLIELLLRANVTERVGIFAAFGWLREADLDLSDPRNPTFRSQENRTPQIIAWANYRSRDDLQIRFGRIVTPQGIINIEHFPPTLLEINQPQFLRPFSGATIFPNFMNGAEVHGRLRVGSGLFSYSLFGGTFAPEPEHHFVGGRAAWQWTPEGVTIGLNANHGSRNDSVAGQLGSFATVPARSTVNNDFQGLGVDLLIDRGPWLWKNELFYSFEDHQEDRLAFYTQPAYRLTEKWAIFYRFDYLDPGQNIETTLEHVAGVNFLPHRLVRLRLAGFFKDYRHSSEDVVVGQLSATISF